MKFSIRDVLWATLVVAVIVWALFARRVTPGRYAMDNNQFGQTVILDTATGQCWVRDSVP